MICPAISDSDNGGAPVWLRSLVSSWPRDSNVMVEKYEVLVNPHDVAAGYETRMRWRDQADWVVSGRRTHEALIPDDLADAVRLRTQARRGPGLVCSRESTMPYALRGRRMARLLLWLLQWSLVWQLRT